MHTQLYRMIVLNGLGFSPLRKRRRRGERISHADNDSVCQAVPIGMGRIDTLASADTTTRQSVRRCTRCSRKCQRKRSTGTT